MASSDTLDNMAKAQANPDLRAPYGLLLARLGSEAVARFRCSLRPLGLAAQQFIVLKQVEAIGPTSQSVLADTLGIDYSNLGVVAGELCGRGLIERTRDERDRRRYSIALTPEGRQLLADADATISRGDAELLSALDDEELEQLWELLRRVTDSLGPQSDADDAAVCTKTAHEPEA